jgi:hypothetical protein
MNLKKDLSDIGYLLITPNPKKFRFEGVNYERAAKQLIVGAVVSQITLVSVVLFGPAIVEAIKETPKKIIKKLKK